MGKTIFGQNKSPNYGKRLIEGFIGTKINENNSEFYLFLEENLSEKINYQKRIRKVAYETFFPKFKRIKQYHNLNMTERVLKSLEDSKNETAPPSLLDFMSRNEIKEFKDRMSKPSF